MRRAHFSYPVGIEIHLNYTLVPGMGIWRELNLLQKKSTKIHFRKTNMETLLFMQLHREGA